LPDAVFYALFRLLPAYKRTIDGPSRIAKRKAWREIAAKLRLDPQLRRELGGGGGGGEQHAESVLANLVDPTLLKNRFTYLKRNAREAALQIGRNHRGVLNPVHQRVLQFYPNNSHENSAAEGSSVKPPRKKREVLQIVG
jgi:hypothetical protein